MRVALLILAFGASQVIHALPEHSCKVLIKGLVDHLMIEETYGPAIPLGDGALKPVPRHIHPKRKYDTHDNLVKFGDTPFYDPNAVYIGIASNPKEGSFHFYLISGNVRLDGGELSETKLHEVKSGKPPLASDGVLFKIPVGEEKRKAIVEAIKKQKGEFVVNCAIPVMKVLNDNGVEIDAINPAGNPSGLMVATNLIFGQVKVGGKRADVEVMATSEKVFNNIALVAERIEEIVERREKPTPKK